MGRLYSVTIDNVAATTAVDFFELTPADDKPIVIHEIRIGQSTEFGDAMDEMLRVSIIRGYTASGTGGSTPTPAPLNFDDAAAGCISDTMNTTLANTGTAVILLADTFNVRSGWLYVPTPECRIRVGQGNTTAVVRLVAAPTDSVTFSATIIFEEL